MKPLRFKYGVFFHPAIIDLQAVAERWTALLVESFRDPLAPELGVVTVKTEFAITHWESGVVFACRHEPGRWMLFADDQTGPVRAGLLEVLDWWNSETLLIAPADRALEWDQHALPNAWSQAWTDGLTVQTITQYPKRLGHRVLAEWNPGLHFLPFEFTFDQPTPEQEAEARKRWLDQKQDELKAALAGVSFAPEASWFSAPALRYRDGLAPDPTSLHPRGNREQAEAWAQEHRGLCFLVDGTTAESHSRWWDR